jgi:hypothetical protein
MCFYSGLPETTTQKLLRIYSILTTAANETMQYIHNTKMRMPVILKEPPHHKKNRLSTYNCKTSLKEVYIWSRQWVKRYFYNLNRIAISCKIFLNLDYEISIGYCYFNTPYAHGNHF